MVGFMVKGQTSASATHLRWECRRQFRGCSPRGPLWLGLVAEHFHARSGLDRLLLAVRTPQALASSGSVS